ncbi:MAG: restriction endonuclease subunit S [Winogradskyella sp.]|uniref:restriction endonuclease subunit S n=1 Tax=Winogradskyella sp. TaxID=1883156 RepID=UPI0017B739F7|nr:restriction endonuclease subunit S [Winogradskyella sp.]
MKEGWEMKQLGEVSKILNGGTPKTKVPEYWNGKINWITPKDLGKLQNKYVFETPRKITELGLNKSSAKLFIENSIILSTRAPIGHLAINKVPISTNQGCKGIVPIKGLEVHYLFYFLKLNIKLLNDLGTGTTFKELSTKALSSVLIPIPPLSEQKAIVKILNETFAKIDRAKANIEKNIANAKELFQSKLNEIFSQRGDGWEERSLGEVCENLDRKRVPITKAKRVKGEIPYYGASGIVDYVADFLFDEDLLLVSEDGANLLARTYPIAFSISGKTWVNNHAHVLKFQNMESQKFIEYYLNSIKLDDYVSGMAQPKLNQRKLNSIKVPFPEFKKQQAINNLINRLSHYKSSIITLSEKKLINLEELKKSLLQKAFAGELT